MTGASFIIALASIATSTGGVTFVKPVWMPSVVSPKYVQGSGVEYASNRVTFAHGAGFLATTDASLERRFFTLPENASRNITNEHQLTERTIVDCGEWSAGSNRNLRSWAPKISVVYTNMVRDAVDGHVRDGLEGRLTYLSSSLLEGGASPVGEGWTDDPVEAHANRRRFFLHFGDAMVDGMPKTNRITRISPLVEDFTPAGDLRVRWEDDDEVIARQQTLQCHYSDVTEAVTGDPFPMDPFPPFPVRVTYGGYDWRNVFLAAADLTYTKDDRHLYDSMTATATHKRSRVKSGVTGRIVYDGDMWTFTADGSWMATNVLEVVTNDVTICEQYAQLLRPPPEVAYVGAASMTHEVWATEEQMIQFANMGDHITFRIVCDADGVWLVTDGGETALVEEMGEGITGAALVGVVGQSSVAGMMDSWVTTNEVEMLIPSRYARRSGRVAEAEVFGGLAVEAKCAGETDIVYRVVHEDAGVGTNGVESAARAVARTALVRCRDSVERMCGYHVSGGWGWLAGMTSDQRVDDYAGQMESIENIPVGTSTANNPSFVDRAGPEHTSLVRVYRWVNDHYEESEKVGGMFLVGEIAAAHTTTFAEEDPGAFTNANGRASANVWVKTKWQWKALPLGE